MNRVLSDVGRSLRSLCKHPGFTAAAVVTIALGIGANVSIYSVVHAVLLRPLPFDEPERLVKISNRIRARPGGRFLVNARDVSDYKQQATTFEDIAAGFFGIGDATLTGGDQPEHIRLESITYNYFSLLGVQPVLGRGFLPEDAIWFPPDAETEPPPTALTISYGLWQRAFGSDPDIIGRTVSVNESPTQIVGVMPPGFGIPRTGRSAMYYDVDVWLPIQFDLAEARRGSRSMLAMGRLNVGVSLEQAQAEMDAIAARLQEEVPQYREEDVQIDLWPLHADLVVRVRPMLLVLMGAVTCLLLLACANVANLFLVRARARALESAVMAALGCSNHRLLRQRLIESLLVALAGGLVGLALAWLGIRWLVAFKPPELSTVAVVNLDPWVLLYALGVSVLSAMVFGLLPAIQATRVNLAQVLKDEARSSGGRWRRGLLSTVVVGEVALSFVLLFGATLLTRTLIEMQRERPGFDPDRALTFNVRMYSRAYRDREVRTNFFRELEERISALPGVQSVGSTNFTPMTGGLWNDHYAWDEESEANYSRQTADFRVVTPDYFHSMGTKLLAGRHFADWEMSEPTSFVIVDEILAQRAWPGENPIGKALTTGSGRERVEVIGVVEHIRQIFVHTDSREVIYWAYGTYPYGALGVIVRTAGDEPAGLVAPIREEIRRMDPGVAIYNVTTLKDLVGNSMASTRFVVMLMGIFAVVAVVLTVVGMYGVISYAVRQRTAEIGIRMALGATGGRILRLVVGHGARLTILGVVLGVVGALLLARFVAGLLFGVPPRDPATIISVLLALSAVALLACYLPARRATRTNPMVVLRTE